MKFLLRSTLDVNSDVKTPSRKAYIKLKHLTQNFDPLVVYRVFPSISFVAQQKLNRVLYGEQIRHCKYSTEILESNKV